MQEDEFEAALAPLRARASKGDETAYRAALSLVAVRLERFFARRLANRPEEVEDLVQETLIALHERRGTHEPGLPVAPWVFAIARHKRADFWRRHGRRDALHEPLDDALTAATTEPGAARDLHALRERCRRRSGRRSPSRRSRDSRSARPRRGAASRSRRSRCRCIGG